MIKIKFFKYMAIILFFVSICIIIPIHTIEGNLFSNYIDPNKRNIVNTIFLESFGFFTKSPKDEQLSLYVLNQEQEFVEINLRNNSYQNAFGLSRKNRRKILDLGRISSLIADSLWVSTRSDSLKLTKFKEIKSYELEYGQNKIISLNSNSYIITKSKIIEWEWNDLKKYNKVKFAKFYVK